MLYTVIMAGGSGTRLWPISREANPKQLHALVNDKVLIQETVDRFRPLLPPENIWIVTNKRYQEQITALVPDVPQHQIIGEPYPLGTTLAIALAMIKVVRRNPEATVVVAWSDSYIAEEENFRTAVKVSARAVNIAEGVIIGVNPTYPATGYGYIQMGEQIWDLEPDRVFWIERFIEKPDLATAKRFAQRWDYLWNPGISVWKAERFLNLLERLCPQEWLALQRIIPYLDTHREEEVLAEALAEVPKIPIDYAIYEKAERLAVVPADLGWSDIGTWDALKAILPPNEGTNRIRGEVITLNTEECLIYAKDRLIATVGLRDIIIVDAGDCLLVAHRSEAQRVKDLVELLRQKGKEQYL